MRSVKVALAVSAVVIAVVIVAVLSRTPSVVAGTNAVSVSGHIDLPTGDVRSCQQVATVPRGTSAFRISVGAGAGPTVRLSVLSDGHVVTGGELPAGWGLEAAAVVPVRRVSREIRGALVCTTLGPGVGPITAAGALRAGAAEPASFSDVELRIEYLRPGARSWWSLASSVAQRVGLGRSVSGTWIAFLALSLMIAVGVLASRVVLTDLR